MAPDPQSSSPSQDGAPPVTVGRIAAPGGAEATSSEFYLWTPEEVGLEKTQLVYVESPVGSQQVIFYGIVTEVFRRSRRSDMLEESDRFDGRPDEQVPIDSRGVTYAQIRVLGSSPKIFAPPREESLVFAAGAHEARIAYGVEEMQQPLVVGLVRNGAAAVAGPACIDIDNLLGATGGHINVTGIAGVGTKSSFLTVALHQLIEHCRAWGEEHPNDPDKPQVRPIILNVKGFDLFWLDHYSTAFTDEDREMWAQMGWAEPLPMDADFYGPQQPGSDDLAVPVGREDVQPYSWSLEDVIEQNLFTFLFSDTDREDDNFALLLADLERLLVQEKRAKDGTAQRKLEDDAPARTFSELFDWFADGLAGQGDDAWMRLEHGQHHPGTLRRFYRRLRRIVYESAGIFRLDGDGSHPLDITSIEAGRPVVIDIQGLPDRHLQRFVVAALLKQAVDDQTGPGALRGMHYVFLLDELNRFAPRGHSDPITQLIETVAAELRSRGVILFGAQQQASLVSTRVVENAAVRVLGRTGGHELNYDLFSWLPASLRDYVEQLESADKVVYEPSFREPMHVRFPRPPWAMRRQEASVEPPQALAGAKVKKTGPRRIRRRPPEEMPS
jgi:DNA helicase HerA-like ATPase